jgi:ferredoxin-type protein NapH
VRSEWAGRVVLGAAVPVTLLILFDAWGVLHHALAGTKSFAQTWYGLVVDFGLASVLGVALYPLLGNRVWCRFFCPLRAGMEIVARKTAKLQILDDGRCIGCGECSRACQMGIDVQRFAQTSTPLHNGNSACIQCGICIEVCPMSVLRIEPTRTSFPRGFSLSPPRPPWES